MDAAALRNHLHSRLCLALRGDNSWCLLVIADLNVTGAVVDVYSLVGEGTGQFIPPVNSSSFNLL